ncbi:MAG: DNA topoisomerase (ATP-hydrolyzing) [Actinomycetota bacterium]|nr:DNA topoisomerase (ATP-hydrolyzing) [Actinomycetota bacterium]MED5173933.1 DNA topoisomerase (ATP-hydrolyzing) [Actinomycetota bacterium]
MAKAKVPEKFAREIVEIAVDDEMRDSFMPYALSVTTSRAIPDVRDGLKPVQRRILYVMADLGLRPATPFRKSAGVVGEVMGKYHPHGDGAIYEAMVRMGQGFSMSVPFVDPKGNFGSLDDPPAAYRYTEARLAAAAMTMVQDLDEDTVDFVPNFDGEREEPVCLPAALPNLLVNGASGIAVGMATNMAPHNLAEVAAVIEHVLTKRRPKPTVDDLMKHLEGPDFPTGGIIVDDGALREAYKTGRGTIRVRARAEIENITARRQGIIVTELPYAVGPERVQAKIRELIAGGKLDGIAAVVDLSDRNHGLRLVIECKAGVGPHSLLEKLYRLTPLEESFGINNVALVDGVPTTLSLYELCKHYIDHRLEVIVRRATYRLSKAEEREHVLLGLLLALDNIEKVISIIRGSKDAAKAKERLVKDLKLTEVQATHILDMQLRRLTALEVDKLREELTEVQSDIAALKKLLASETKQRNTVRDELRELVAEFSGSRRSSVISESDLAVIDDEVIEVQEEMVDELGDQTTLVTLSTSGLLGRRSPDDEFKVKPGRHDVVARSLETSAYSPILAVTDHGRLLTVKAREVPEMVRGSRGASVTEMFSLARGEKVVGLFGEGSDPIVLVTRNGVAKRLESQALTSLRTGSSAINLKGDDRVVSAFTATEDTEIIMVASDGQALRTASKGISLQGPGAGGVAGMKLKPGARLLAAGVVDFGTMVLVVSDEGAVKGTDVAEIPAKGRATGGVRTVKWRDFETTATFAWVGRNQQLAAVVADSQDEKKLEPTPEPLSIEPTRRDGQTISLENRVVLVGEYRF